MTDEERHEILVQMRIALAELRKEVQLRSDATERALVLQANEYDRRLTILNHEAEQLKAMQMTYVPRETHILLSEKVDGLMSFKDTLLGRQSIITIIVSAFIAALVSMFLKGG
jgi:hypothetical protein